ncbi:hypothetical protein SAMN02745127_02069 [Oceanospirillum multiglobuliferum]|uniref:Uncharacterized protein n=1 Tax=Oceanospirillum multiglobuliferum TaxID=64969 RepID=A0A1T4QYY4_9GAMM|nr:hypothetical protein [Oceanospirillum multiglobuliferum]OPX57070.1 hypothetical protein BTE48_01170 [Oceanospirillum multiglobuliferum]SKA08558.1 hypothetical protein SAMN02745127_02069 [Oceanospirillum multiglobuliferum]
MLLMETEARLEAIADSLLDNVGSAVSLATAMERPPVNGVSCFVVPVAEQPEKNQRVSGPAVQKVLVTVGVVFAIRTLNDPDGERGSQKLETARDAVRQALFGWQAEGTTAPYLLSTSGLIRMENNVIWWMDRYQTQIQRRAAA